MGIEFGSNKNNEGIQHWKCSSCGKKLTYKEDDEVKHITHFDIERSIKSLFLENGDIEEYEEGSNLKMQRFLCEECFVKVLNESPTLAKLFYVLAWDKFTY